MKLGIMQKLALATGIGVGVSLSAAILRSLLFKRQNDEDVFEEDCNKPMELKLEVPRKSLGIIIGKRGMTIKKLREDHEATIKVCDQSDEIAQVIIRGQRDNVESAMKEIKKLVEISPRILTKEVILSDKTWSSVVGLNGDNVRLISSESKATITVKWLDAHHSDHASNSCKYVVTVKGSREQIDYALSLIDERVAQASLTQNNTTISLAGRALLDNVIPAMPGTVTSAAFPTSSADGFTEVFVSAIESPSLFWVQLCGPQSTELDKLISEMTEFYKKELAEQSTYRIQSIVSGDLVAAYYDGDKDWYRALVLSVDKLSSKQTATVLFVDFGDSAVVELNMIMKLKPEYLAIPLQAIKCSLHGVSPANDERWSQEAIQLFENLTYLAQWKPIMAKPVLCADKTGILNNNHCSTSPELDIVPVVLIDTNNAQDIDIAKQLVDNQHAVENSH